MRNLWREFKAFAMSGNVLDLALGFLIGAAFASLVESLANNVLMELVAAIFGKPSFTELQVGPIKYGQFLTDLVNFLILAAVMFAVLKLVVRLGITRARTGSEAQCPYCHESIPQRALTCRACGQQLVDELPAPQEARRLLAEQQQEQQARRGLNLPQLPIPGRRQG